MGIGQDAILSIHRERLEYLEDTLSGLSGQITDQIGDIAALKLLCASMLAERSTDRDYIARVTAIAMNAIDNMQRSDIADRLSATVDEISDLGASISTLSGNP